MKKVLVLGATGAMGRYLVPALLKKGYLVDGVAIDPPQSTDPSLRYLDVNAEDISVMTGLLKNNYDGIVDFMVYPTARLAEALPFFLDRTDHYIFLSSYRVYDGKDIPVTENTSRLIDTGDDAILRNSDDYSIYKARGENMLHALEYKNWTIIRPAITYSFLRYQLVTLEAPLTVGRAFRKKKVVLPAEAQNVQATMSWGGDVANMIAGLLFNEKALCETFTVSTAEHRPWGVVADYYRDICGLEAVWVPKEDFLRCLAPGPYCQIPRWQLEYDRLFNRVIDNSKVLAVTGMKQSDLMPLYDGLAREIAHCRPEQVECTGFRETVEARMDALLAGRSGL